MLIARDHYDRLGGYAPTLDLTASGAPSFGGIATNVQYWSDGQHSGTWQLSQPSTATLAPARTSLAVKKLPAAI